ncbi:unnamed protein product, partial [Eretmochelys imbricata]
MLILILLPTAFLLPPGAGAARSLYLGAHNIKQWEQSQQNISMRRRIPHPQYNRETLDNDIMLLQSRVRTDTLREVDLEVMRDNMCELYPGYNPTMMLCVGKPGLGKLPYW